MKKRIIKVGNWWYGQVYATWNNIFCGEYTDWVDVTPNCYTYIGAKFELEKWIIQNCPKEYSI